MELNELVKMQFDFDDKHGWNPVENDIRELIIVLHKDLVGLYGEIGELSNILKKIALVEKKLSSEDLNSLFEARKENLAEELIDSLIYMMRIASNLKIDLEAEYLKKLKFNKERYQSYENEDKK